MLSPIGIDISDRSVKCVQFQTTLFGQRLIISARCPLAPGMIEHGEIKNDTGVIAALQTLKEKTLRPLTGTFAVASLPEEKTFLKLLAFPPKTELDQSTVAHELEHHIPLPLDSLLVDWQEVRPRPSRFSPLEPATKFFSLPLHREKRRSPPAGQSTLRVLVAAAEKKTVDLYLSVLSRAGFTPLALETEAQAISRLYPSDQVTTLIGARAQERLVRELAPGQTMIHLATHGIIRDDEPLESLLALAPETNNPQSAIRNPQSAIGGATSDGLLTLREVFQLDLSADLVVLSACNTGLGQISGDGVIGLSRAFIYAGTPSVMVSLWRVADIVVKSEMEQFYRALKRTGGNKAAALRQAQLETLRRLRRHRLRGPSGKPLREHPIFWAPFVLIGEAL